MRSKLLRQGKLFHMESSSRKRCAGGESKVDKSLLYRMWEAGRYMHLFGWNDSIHRNAAMPELRRKNERGGAMTREMQGPCEEIEQTCLFRWAALESGAHPELALLHAIPNGGKRSKSEAARMKAAGVKPGVPDMFLPVAREGCHGLYIELKRRDGGRVSTEQTAWMDALARQGYKTALCHGWDAAREEIQRYLGGKWSCG